MLTRKSIFDVQGTFPRGEGQTDDDYMTSIYLNSLGFEDIVLPHSDPSLAILIKFFESR